MINHDTYQYFRIHAVSLIQSIAKQRFCVCYKMMQIPSKSKYLIIILIAWGFLSLLFYRYLATCSNAVVFATNQTTTFGKLFSFVEKKKLPWYFTNGVLPPESHIAFPIWPNELQTDRIHEQLMTTARTDSFVVKTIFAESAFRLPLGDSKFQHCPVDRCSYIDSREDADAVLFYNIVNVTRENVPNKQVWILSLRESPVHTRYGPAPDSINWTATYRSDSEIPKLFGKWMYYDEDVQENLNNTVNYAAGKTRSVAWFVSNCHAKSRRLEFARELQQYIDVDIYGRCGNLNCNKSVSGDCFELVKQNYKFYLAFENSYCHEYITEKFFVNALGNDVVPVVMGAHPDDYKRVAPRNSYIHVDDFGSAKELAEYLHHLSANDHLYNAYFKWKGTGQFINTRFDCRLCALLHSNSPPRHYPNFKNWWAADGICRNGTWT